MAALIATGCSGTYWRNRGRDAMEMMDAGIVVSKRPRFALFNDYFGFVPLGHSNVKGTLHGIGNRQFGSTPIHVTCWGALAWGSMRLQVGEFDLDNPFQVSPEWVAALRAANKPSPTATPRYNTGFLRMALRDRVPPRRTGFMCRRSLHVGWVGFYMSTHYDEIVPFFLGWFGVGRGGEAAHPPPSAGPAAGERLGA